MKSNASLISIRKASNGYTVSVRQGRKTSTFSMKDKNSARSFVRRNFAQKGHYSA